MLSRLINAAITVLIGLIFIGSPPAVRANSTSVAGAQVRRPPGLTNNHAAATISNFTGSQTITFDEFGEGTLITDQYEPQGVIFLDSDEGPPYVAWDNASFENPVLSGTPTFYGAIRAQFVLAGTSIPATINGMQVTVGYIDNPGAVQLTVETNTGNEVIPADEFGFNVLTSNASNIMGFTVETTGEEEAGFEIDNLSFTPATPPPLPPPSPQPNCAIHQGGFWHRVLAGLKCKLAHAIPVAECVVNIASDFPQGRLVKTAAGLYDLRKVRKEFQPAVKLYNDILKLKIAKNAPHGYRTFGEIKSKLEHIHSAWELAKMLPNLYKAFVGHNYKQIFSDLIDLAGLRPCFTALTQ